jgi:hypothetical protein
LSALRSNVKTLNIARKPLKKFEGKCDYHISIWAKGKKVKSGVKIAFLTLVKGIGGKLDRWGDGTRDLRLRPDNFLFLLFAAPGFVV